MSGTLLPVTLPGDWMDWPEAKSRPAHRAIEKAAAINFHQVNSHKLRTIDDQSQQSSLQVSEFAVFKKPHSGIVKGFGIIADAPKYS